MVAPALIAAASAVGGKILNTPGLFGNKPNYKPVDWIKPGKAEQAGKAAAVFGPGNKYDLGLSGMTAGGSSLSGLPAPAGSNNQTQAFNPFRSQVSSSSSSTGFDPAKAFTAMFNDPNTTLKYKVADTSQPVNAGPYGTPTTTQDIVNAAAPKAAAKPGGITLEEIISNPNFANALDRIKNLMSGGTPTNIKEGFAAGLAPYESQKALQGVGQEAYETGTTTQAQAIGQLQDLITNMFNTGNQNKAAGIARTDALGNVVSNNANNFSNFFNTNSNDFSAFDRAAGQMTDKYANASFDATGKAINAAGQNISTAQNLTNKATSQADVINNFVNQRFNKTDELLNQIQSGNVSAEEQALVDQVFNQGKEALTTDITTGPAAREYTKQEIAGKEAAERRGLSGDSSPVANAMADVANQREAYYNSKLNELQAQRAASLLGIASENRGNALKGADIANQGATSFAQTGKGLLDTGVSGVNAATAGVDSITNAANTLASLDKNTAYKAEAATNTAAEKQKAITNAGNLLLAGGAQAQSGQQAVNDSGRQVEQDFNNILTAIQSMVNDKATIGGDMSKTGLEANAQAFNELMSILSMLAGNRKDKLALNLANARGVAGLGGSVG